MSRKLKPESDPPAEVPTIPVGNGQLIVRQPGTLAYFTSAPRSNLDLSTQAGRMSAFNAAAQQPLGIADLKGEPFAAVAYVLSWQEQIDEDTGEIRQFPRVTFVGESGDTFSTTSETVIRNISGLLEACGNGPWNPPIRLVFAERRARRSGRTYHEMRVLAPDVTHDS